MDGYQEGYKDGIKREWTLEDVDEIKKAIKDCQERGWLYFEEYFRGQLDAYTAKKETNL
jgi:hypothetical protein